MLLLPPWTQHCSKHHLLLLALASPLGDEKNHDESTVKAISFSASYPKNLFLSAACSLFLLPWHTSGCPNMNNVSKTYWSQGIIFTPSYSGEKLLLSGDCPCPSPVFMQHGNSSEQSLKSKPPCCPSTILAFPLQGKRTAIPYGLTRGREMPHAELDDEQCGSSMTPGNSAPNWAVVEMKSWSYFFLFFCWNLGVLANWCYYVLWMIYGGRNEANCPLRVTIARLA